MLNCLHHEEKCQQYKDQPQHPVFPLQLRHLRQNAQSFLRKSSKANLFEENKVPSDPIPIVKLPAAKHWAHAGMVFKYISNSCTTLRYPDKKKFIKQICCQPLVSSRLRRWGLLVTRSMILNVLLYALNAAILDKSLSRVFYLPMILSSWLSPINLLAFSSLAYSVGGIFFLHGYTSHKLFVFAVCDFNHRIMRKLSANLEEGPASSFRESSLQSLKSVTFTEFDI